MPVTIYSQGEKSRPQRFRESAERTIKNQHPSFALPGDTSNPYKDYEAAIADARCGIAGRVLGPHRH